MDEIELAERIRLRYLEDLNELRNDTLNMEYNVLKEKYEKSTYYKFKTEREYYECLDKLSEQEKFELDIICYAVRNGRNVSDGLAVSPNRIFALMVLDLYEQWQLNVFSRL